MKIQNIFVILICSLFLSNVSFAAYDVTEVTLQTNDIIYDSHRQQIYASVPGSEGAAGNSITIINPVTGAIGASIFVGSEPNKLAISDDGQYLYVSLDGAAAVRRVNLATFTADMQFELGSSAFYGPYRVEDMEVQPGNANTIAASLMRDGVSPRHAGVAIYDDGIQRTNVTPDHTGSNRIVFSSLPSKLYGYNNESTEFGFRGMLIDEAGVTVENVARDYISGFGVDIEYDAGRIYSTSGVVLEADTPTVLGSYAGIRFAKSVVPDASSNHTYFLTSNNSIEIYNLNNFTFIESVSVPNASGMPGSLILTQKNELAYRTDAGQVLLLSPATETYLKLSPPSGDYLSTQQFDLGVLAKTGMADVTAISHATINGVDVSAELAGCLMAGHVDVGYRSFRCPQISLYLQQNPSTQYNFDIALTLSDDSVVSQIAVWRIIQTVEGL